jgi:predicted  nucleic acid-binding Zn-ribbon protein
MASCLKCGDEFSDKRKELGYETCLKCGEEDAQDEIESKKKRVAVAYNKGPVMYITSESMVKDLGKK